ncbi:MAG: cytochrome P460 family protein [Thermoanaerobaculia bacterium]|nr:cytochrome P460 family protein [Thermoanaerobaculia bacterium]
MNHSRSGLFVGFVAIALVVAGGIAHGMSHEGPSAEKLWKKIEGYESWNAYPGLPDGFYEGTRPHGAQLKTYGNEKVAENPDNPPAGAIIIKENYTPDRKLVAITVMKKIEGYNPDADDWFWAKYQPDGEVAMKDGKALAGKVGSCIGCHASAKDDDYIYANDE